MSVFNIQNEKPTLPKFPKFRNNQSLAQFHVQRWFVHVPAGYSMEQALDPQNFADWKLMQANDLVEIQSAVGDFDVLVRVTAVFNGIPSFRILRSWQAPTVQDFQEARDLAGNQDLPRIEYLPGSKWRVLNKDGDEIVRDLKSESEAQAALDQLERGEGT